MFLDFFASFVNFSDPEYLETLALAGAVLIVSVIVILDARRDAKRRAAAGLF